MVRGHHRSLRVAAAVAAALGVAARAGAEHPAIARAERAVEAGAVDPERDLAPLLQALARSRNVDERRELVGAIADLGAADAESPNAVKQYLVRSAPPVLLEVARTGADPFLQGDAISALRGMDVPRSVLEQAAAIAEADPDEFVQSRGEILRNYIASMPVEDTAAAKRVADPVKERAAVAYLDERGIAASTEALRDAAGRADPDTVRALLDAGIAPDTGAADATQTPLYFATAQACHSQGAETDWLVETVSLLVAAGADVNRLDDNRNTPLFHAAHYCGPRIVGVLVEGGAQVGARNGSGVSPLAMALIVGNLDAAEALVARGARLAKEDGPMVSGVTDPRGRALIARASR
jgi:hypothetical protein